MMERARALSDLCLSVCLSPAYNYSVENEMLTESLDKQHSRVHELYSTVAGRFMRLYEDMKMNGNGPKVVKLFFFTNNIF